MVPSTEMINLGGEIGFVREDDGTFSCRQTEFEVSVGHPKVELSSRQSDAQVESSGRNQGWKSKVTESSRLFLSLEHYSLPVSSEVLNHSTIL